ncbi:transcription initiation factor TFIID subunit 3 isoform X2 [Nematostella vectensis]|uniref:transcription initiation factor TFIID subunit 3 isoform X2 n=1 Tax=Nematostella vectensis TaxID=45351 RepID=UPI0020771A87|nr:transcription initiation factor TFIID subunit 3 isoform X2 [Nematostella vectensis]
MTERFNHFALRVAVAQICQSMGWDSLHKSTHDLLTDVMQKYMEEIAKSAHAYCQLYCHTEPNLDDLGLAFSDTGVLLNELEDYVTQVDQVHFFHQLPRFPKPKACLLHHPCNGEIAERAEYYHEHLPPLIKALQPTEDEGETGPAETIDPENGQEQQFLRSEIKTVAEETHNDLVGNLTEKRSLDSPSEADTETKRRRLEHAFLSKNNKENELDILQALQEKISPSPSPSPDILPMDMDEKSEGVFKFTAGPIPPKVKSTLVKKSPGKTVKEKKTTSSLLKSPDTGATIKPKVKKSPAKKKHPKKAVAEALKNSKTKSPSATPSPISSPIKSPVTSPILSKAAQQTAKESASPKTPKQTSVKVESLKSPPSKILSPSKESSIEQLLPLASAMEEPAPTMPKLIFKPVKQEKGAAPEYSVAQMVSHLADPEEKKKAKKHPGDHAGPALGEPKKKKKKKGTNQGGTSVFSIANFLPPSCSTPEPGPSNPLGDEVIKKKKKKHKDKDKTKDKHKTKKIKQENKEFMLDPLSIPGNSGSSIPRIKLKLEPPSTTDMLATTKEAKQPTAQKIVIHTNKEPKIKKTSSHVGLPGSTMGTSHLKQEPDLSTATSSQAKDSIARTVVTETLSSTVQLYFCPACGFADDGSFMIGCDSCDKWYHGSCVGVLDDPGGDWYCVHCTAKKAKKKKKKKSKVKEKLRTM